MPSKLLAFLFALPAFAQTGAGIAGLPARAFIVETQQIQGSACVGCGKP